MKSIISFLGGAAIWAAGHLGVLSFLSPTVQGVVTVVAAAAAVLGARGAIAPVNAALTAKLLDILPKGLKTILGAVLAVVTYVLSPEVVGQIPPKVVSILMVISTILIALGVTHQAAVNAVKTQ